MQDILERLSHSSVNESSHELQCRCFDAADEISRLRNAIKQTLDDNGHLADTEVGTGFSKDAMLAKAAEEIEALRTTLVDLLEILRQWEPDHASGENRRRIVLALYQIGVLRDPTKTVATMKVGAG